MASISALVCGTNPPMPRTLTPPGPSPGTSCAERAFAPGSNWRSFTGIWRKTNAGMGTRARAGRSGGRFDEGGFDDLAGGGAAADVDLHRGAGLRARGEEGEGDASFQ